MNVDPDSLEAAAGVPWTAVKDWTAETILGVVVLLILTGLLLPLRSVKRELAAKDREISIHEKASTAKDDRIEVLLENNRILTETNRQLTDEYGQTVNKVMGELQGLAREGVESHG